ncbi:MAG: hypothetical protein CM15mP74_12090 [Halieaceae bacterium]|nr:MAG: hypothetical protein CM15mP74_12090 [Halieaceae bacterium]
MKLRCAPRVVESRGVDVYHPFETPMLLPVRARLPWNWCVRPHGPLDYVFVCCGGGGLLAGMATYLRYVWPQTKIIGVEPEDAACVQAALHKGRRVTLREVGLFADGCAVAQVGKETFRLIRESVDDVMTVSTDEICAAVKDIFEDTRAIAEPAGALAVAGMKKYALQHRISGATMAATVSGANTNFDRLRYISERTEIGERREAVLSVTIPERPGAFRAFCNAIGKRNVTEFNYRYETAAAARVFVGLTVTPGDDSLDALQRNLRERGYRVLDLTDNETAKLHLRHMIGGRQADDIAEEIVFRVEFPERPGSLLQFLNALGNEFSITLFHYRNHGAAYGRILVGMQVPPGKRAQLRKALLRLGYPFWEESDNPAYLEYLGRLNTD